VEIYGIAPFPESTAGSLGNAFYFVILVGIGASFLYFLVKRKSLRIIKFITGFVLSLAVFMLSIIYLSVAFSTFYIPYAELLTLMLSFAITVVAYFAIFRTHSKYGNIVVLGLGGALGTFLGIAIPTLSTILILTFLAAYDIFAVYHGPVGKIARNGLDHLKGLSFSFKDIQMGLGDLTFYSMLSGHMLLYFGFLSCLISIIGILLGCLITFRMLAKKGMFPGLPFPILLGLTAGLLASVI